MKTRARIFVVGALLVLLPIRSNAAPADALVGCYATKKGGKAEIRVQRRGTNYYLAIGANWKDEGIARQPTPKDVEKVFKDQSRFYITGLYSGMLGIFKVRPGMTIHNRPVSGNYVALVIIDAGEVWRTACR